MFSSLRELLEVPTVYSVFNEAVRVNSGYCSNLMLSGRPKIVSYEDEVHSFNWRGPETPAPMNIRGGAPQQTDAPVIIKRQSGMFRIHTYLPLMYQWLGRMTADPSTTVEDRNSLTILQQLIMAQVAQHTMTVDLMAIQTMFFGMLYRDSSHNILTPTAHATTGAITAPNGAAFAYEFNIPDTSRGNLDGVISDQWSAADTDIEAQLILVREKAAQERRAIPDTISFRAADWPKLRNNTKFETWAVNNQAAVDAVLAGEPVKGLWGWTWKAVDPQYQVNTSNALVNLWPANRVLITSSKENAITVTDGVERFASGADEYIVGGAMDMINQLVNEQEFLIGDFMFGKIRRGTNAGLELHRGLNRGWDVQQACIFTPKVFS
jgi:rhodanese-related sulfurtransferase